MAIKLGDGVVANNKTVGKIVQQELFIDLTSKTEQISNGDFVSDVAGWTATFGSIAWVAGTMEVTDSGAGGAGEQIFDTEVGALQVFKFDRVSGGVNTIAQIQDVNGTNIISNTVGDGSYEYYFYAKTPKTIVNFFTAVAGVMAVDNVSIKKANIQFINAPGDIFNKPNVDDQGGAWRVQTLSDSGTAWVSGIKDFNVDGTDYLNYGYNNYKFRTDSLATIWDGHPVETEDLATEDTRLYNITWDKQLGNEHIGLKLYHGTGGAVNGNYKLAITINKGKSWKDIDIGSVLDTGAAVYGVNNTNSYNFLNSKIVIKDKKFAIVLAGWDGTWGIRPGAYGTIDDTIDGGSVVIQICNGASGNNIFNASNSFDYVDLQELNDEFFVIGANSSTNQISISKSIDFGENWSADGTTTPGASTAVKTVGAAVVQSAGRAPRLVLSPQSGAPTKVKVSVIFVDSTGALDMASINSDDLTLNWQSKITLIAFAGEINLIDAKLSPDQTQLAFLSFDRATTAIVDAGIVLMNTATILAPVGTSDINAFGNVDDANGFTSNTVEVFVNNRSSIMWGDNNQTAYFCFGTQNTDSARRLSVVKVPDVATMATNTTTFVVDGSSASVRATESSFVKSGTEMRIIWKATNTAEASWLTNGRVLSARIVDAQPAVNIAPEIPLITDYNDDGQYEDISAKPSFTNFCGHIQVQQLTDRAYVSFERVGTDGFEVVCAQSFYEKEFNILAEEWSKVPVTRTVQVTDNTLYDFAEANGVQLLVAQASITSMDLYSSVTGFGNLGRVASGITTGFTPNNSTDFFITNPAIDIDENNNFVLVYANRPVTFDETYYINGSVDSVGNVTLGAATALFADGTYHQNRKIAHGNGKFYAFSSGGGGTPTGYIAVATAGGAFGAQISVKNGGVAAQIFQNSPISFFVKDLGGGINRVCIVGSDNGGTGDVKMWYSDDDGVTWATEIIIAGGTSSALHSHGFFGDKVALAIYQSASTTALQLSICDDLTAGTPTFSAITNVADGVGTIDTSQGYTAASASLQYGKNQLEKIRWIDATSLTMVVDRVNVGGFTECVMISIPNTAAIVPAYTVVFPAVINDQYFGSQMAISDSGSKRIVSVNLDLNGNGLTKGRGVSKKIFSDLSLGTIEDIAFKPDITVGGALPRLIVHGKTAGFEKDNGASVEQVYINDLTEKTNAEF